MSLVRPGKLPMEGDYLTRDTTEALESLKGGRRQSRPTESERNLHRDRNPCGFFETPVHQSW